MRRRYYIAICSFGVLILTMMLLPSRYATHAYPDVERPTQEGGRFVPGKFGQAYLSQKKGDRYIIPTDGYIRRERGTIEMWLRQTKPKSDRPEWSAVFTAQEEPYPKSKRFNPFALKGLILQFTEHGKKLIFLLGPLLSSKSTLVVNNLDWQPGEDHLLSVSWGEQGMHMFIDGREVASNKFTGSLPSMPRMMAVGSYVWEGADQPSEMAIDDFTISDVQKSESEIMDRYRSSKASRADDHTLLLMSFDQPPYPSVAKQGAPASSVPPAPSAQSHPAGNQAPNVVGGQFEQGKFGKGYETLKPGDMITYPTAGNIRLDQGTIEMWVKPSLPPKERPDWAALFSMLMEDSTPTNIRGLIITFVDNSKRIVFSLGKLGDGKTMVATPVLNWQQGETHHLSASWGPQGMRLYIDGKRVAQNNYRGTLPNMPAEMAVGSHLWEIVRRPSFTVIDDFKISSVQKSDDEIARDASANAPATRDANTLVLATFDDDLARLPVTLTSDRPFNIFQPGQPVTLTIPADRLPQTLQKSGTPVHIKVQGGAESTVAGNWTSSGLQVNLGRAAQPGFFPVQVAVGSVKPQPAYYWVAGNLPMQDAENSVFGVGQFEPKSMDAQFFTALRALGVKWLRVPFDWQTIEPQRGQNDWALYDRITSLAKENDIHIMATLFWEQPLPSWQGKSASGTNKYSVSDMGAWQAHVRQVVSRYKNSVDAWDPWNEPNLNTYWYPKPNPKDYVSFLKPTYETIKSVDPKAVVVSFGLSEIDLDFYRKAFELGALHYSDIVAVHPYIFPASPDEIYDVANLGGLAKLGTPMKTTWSNGLQQLKKLIRDNGGSQKIWITELGQHSAPIPGVLPPGLDVSEEKQADYLAKFFVESLSTSSVQRLFWFSFWGSAAGPFAILNQDGSPKQAGVAYRTLVEHLANARAVGAKQSGDLKIFNFDVNGKPVTVVWSTGGSAKIVAKPAQAKVFNLMGQLQQGASVSGGTSFTITSRPLIVAGGAVEAY